MTLQLTPHFSCAEMCWGSANDATQGGPIPAYLLPRVYCLCAAVLEPIRIRHGRVLVTSGYRPADTDSQHGRVEAADLNLPEAGKMVVFLWLMENEPIPVDMAIVYEDTGHLHVSHTIRRDNRRTFLVASRTDDGEYTYTPWGEYTGPLKARP